jgi:hypothetical protein
MEILFYIIRDDEDWEPDAQKDYSYVDIEKLKKIADDWFDILNLEGEFFYDYNDVLFRIEKLRKFKELKEKDSEKVTN